jgi:tetratricopeptide (TPR) repeat protein
MGEPADRTESLFAAASALPPEEREAYLERECSGEPDLLHRLVVLLKAHDRAGHVIDRPANGDLDKTAGYAPTSEQPGTIIAGRYKLLEEIGQGGMGTVWAAEQTAPVRRKVALKLIKAGMDSRSVLARFEAERQALALMDHPNIAKVLDGGLTESGRPYFVMEYVKGVPITDYCDATRLSVEKRLSLFIQVCSALQHAHQKGIIHRDLKPSNILVAPYDEKPVPKVIDFGLAKAMHQSLTEKTLYTAHEMVLGTPLYMSPEQAQLNNLDVDTRADIYSLGVLLYELLTGTTPLERRRFKEAAWDEIRRMIREEEPPRLSIRLSSTDTLPSLATVRQTEPAKLKKLVKGELDWIVMKALEKDRTRRYETANGLARDIQRYLDDEVVEARPPSPGYRLGKFVRRNRAQVIAAGLVLLALLTGIAGTTWGLVREARAKARLSESLVREQKANTALSAANAKVQARYDLAVDAIKTFHTGVSEDFLLKEEKFKELRNRLLKSAADFYRKLSKLLGKETDFGSRRALAGSKFELAALIAKVGRTEDALAAHRAVLAAREALAAEPGAGTAEIVDAGWSLIVIAGLLNGNGKTDEALAMYRRAELLLADLAGREPSARQALAICRSMMGWALFGAGKTAEALAAYKLARADQEALAAVPEASNEARNELADTVGRIGGLLLRTGKLKEAELEYRRAVAIHQKLADDNPGVTGFQWSLAHSCNDLGILLRSTDKLAEAEVEHRRAIGIMQKLADDNPAVAGCRFELVIYHDTLGLVLESTSRPAEAEAEYRKALALVQKIAEDHPTITNFRVFLSTLHANLGVLLSNTGRPAEAEAELRTAVAVSQKLADDHPDIVDPRTRLAYSHYKLGNLLSNTGRPTEAEAEYREALALVHKLAEDSPAVTDFRYGLAIGHNMLGRVLAREQRFPEAFTALDTGLAIRQKLAESDPKTTTSTDLAESYAYRGGARVLARQPTEAAADLRLALELWSPVPGSNADTRRERARALALLAGLAKDPKSGVTGAEAITFADQSVAALRDAINAGWTIRDQLKHPDFDPLRGREDFKKLVAEAKAEQSAKRKH